MANTNPDYVIYGAGSSVVNGDYYEDGTYNGAPCYSKNGEGTYWLRKQTSTKWVVIKTTGVLNTIYYSKLHSDNTPYIGEYSLDMNGQNPPAKVRAWTPPYTIFRGNLQVENLRSVVFPGSVVVTGKRSVNTDTTWTTLDETALLVGIKKRKGELTADFAKRVQIAANTKPYVSRTGVLSGLVMETGMNLSYWASINCDVPGSFFEVTPDYILLYTNNESKTATYISFIDIDPDSGDILPLRLDQLVNSINSKDHWEITVMNNDLLFEYAYMMPIQSSQIRKENWLNTSTFTSLDKNIVKETFVILADIPQLSREVPIHTREDMEQGDYCVDYENGTFFCYDNLPFSVKVQYKINKMPYLMTYSPFALIPLISRIYAGMTFGDGTPVESAERIMYRMLKKGTKTHWSTQ